MAGSAVAQLEALLVQLRDLDLQNTPPELEQQLGAVAEAAKAHLDRRKNVLLPAPDPNETQRTALEILSPGPSTAPNLFQGGQQAEIGFVPQNPAAPIQCVPYSTSTSSPASLQLRNPMLASNSAVYASPRQPPPSLQLGNPMPTSSSRPYVPPTQPPPSPQLRNPTPTLNSVPYAPPRQPPHSSSDSAASKGKFPWVNVDFGDSRPSESAYTNPAERRQFGMPLNGVLPLEPPLELFVWPEESLSQAGKPEADRLVPAPSAPPPPTGCGVYPEAPEYVLNVELDRSYRRGWRYAAPFHLHTKNDQKEKMLHIQMPPKVTPTRFNLTTRSFVANGRGFFEKTQRQGWVPLEGL